MSPDTDPVEEFVGFGILSTDPGDDPALTSSFWAAWHETAEILAGDPEALDRTIAAVTTGDRPRITMAESNADGVIMRTDGSWVRQWPSRMALIADLVTKRTLAGPVWDALGRAERVDPVAQIRGLAEQHSIYRGSTRVSDEMVESRCYTTTVIAVPCADCSDCLAGPDLSPSPFAPGS